MYQVECKICFKEVCNAIHLIDYNEKYWFVVNVNISRFWRFFDEYNCLCGFKICDKFDINDSSEFSFNISLADKILNVSGSSQVGAFIIKNSIQIVKSCD